MPPLTISTKASRLRKVSRAVVGMSIRSFLGNWIGRHNQLLWFRSNGQRLERSQLPHFSRASRSGAFFANARQFYEYGSQDSIAFRGKPHVSNTARHGAPHSIYRLDVGHHYVALSFRNASTAP